MKLNVLNFPEKAFVTLVLQLLALFPNDKHNTTASEAVT